MGEMIVYQDVAQEVIGIFKQLYQIHYPIEKMVLPENLIDSNKEKFASTLDYLLAVINSNDTYGFFCRADTQTSNKFSAHSLGLAMDVNPYYNPMIGNELFKLQAGNRFANRNLNHIGMIKEQDPVFYIFLNHGWEWGGFFKKGADYMHFQKVVSTHYFVKQLQYIPPGHQVPGLHLLS